MMRASCVKESKKVSDLLIKLVFQGSKMVASLGRVWGEAVARRSRRVGSCVPSYWAFFACLSSLLLSVMMTGCVGESGVVVALESLNCQVNLKCV